jgi:hypothetical protein
VTPAREKGRPLTAGKTIAEEPEATRLTRRRGWGDTSADCFSAIPYEELKEAVEERVCDQSVLKPARRMLASAR